MSYEYKEVNEYKGIRTFADWNEKEPGFGTCGKDYRLQRIKRQILDS